MLLTINIFRQNWKRTPDRSTDCATREKQRDMAESTRLPNTQERPRSRSAKARLTPSRSESATNKGGVIREDVLKEARERAKSAKLIRGKHTASTQVFPAHRSVKSNKERFTSMYSTDYDGTYVSPPELRPTSPTRRNNPHPAKVSSSV